MRMLAPVAALLLSATILLAGNGLQTTLLPVRAEMEIFPAFSIGLMGSAYFLGFVAGCLLTSNLVRRVGHIRVFTAMVAGASAMPLVHILVIDPVAWWVLRAVTGFCIAALFLVIESWLNERADNHTRGAIFSIYTTLNYAAITVGQLMIMFYDPRLFPLFAIASVLVSVAAIPVALTTSAAPAPLSNVRMRPLHLLRISPVGVVGCAAIGMCNGAFWSLGPAYAVGIGFNTTQIALFMSVTVIGGALSQWPFGRLSDRLDRRMVIIGVGVLSAMSGLGLFLVTGRWPAAIAPLAFAFGAFSFPVYALSVAHVNDLITNESFVEVSSGLLLVNGLAAVIGPLLAATAMGYAGPAALFLFIAIIYLVLSAFAFLRMRIRPLPAETHGAEFVVVAETVATNPVALDPRADDASSDEEVAEGVEMQAEPADVPEPGTPAEAQPHPEGATAQRSDHRADQLEEGREETGPPRKTDD